MLSGYGPIFDRRSTIAAIKMSKNVVGHSKLIGGVNYVTILNIGGSKGSALGAQASPSHDTKNFSKESIKTSSTVF